MGLPVGFLLLRSSVLCAAESLSLFYLLFIFDLYALGDVAWINYGSLLGPGWG